MAEAKAVEVNVKVKVIKKFNDRYKHERREKDKIYEYPKKRAEQLIADGFAELVAADKKDNRN